MDNHGGNVGHRDKVLQTRSNRLARISEIHRFYDPLQYVLIFPQGMWVFLVGWRVIVR